MRLTKNYAEACLVYEAESGALIWRVRPREHFTSARAHAAWNSRWAGKPAGSCDGKRVQIKLDGRLYKAHRIVWLLSYGVWPKQDIDHADGDPANNKVSNLRLATNQQNQFNRGASKRNTSGYKGVYWDKPSSKWRAQICYNRRSVFLGHYDTPEEAAVAYAEGAKRYAREFARID